MFNFQKIYIKESPRNIKSIIPPGSLIGVIYGCKGVRDGCIGVSLPIPYRDVSLAEHKTRD